MPTRPCIIRNKKCTGNKVKIFLNSSIINSTCPSNDNIPLRRDNFSPGLTNSTSKKVPFNDHLIDTLEETQPNFSSCWARDIVDFVC